MSVGVAGDGPPGIDEFRARPVSHRDNAAGRYGFEGVTAIADDDGAVSIDLDTGDHGDTDHLPVMDGGTTRSGGADPARRSSTAAGVRRPVTVR